MIPVTPPPNQHKLELDVFYEVPSRAAALAALHALANTWPDDILTGLHYISGQNDHPQLVGASFLSPIPLETIRSVIGPTPKLTELTLDNIIARAQAGEFSLAILGDAARALTVETP